jgi:tetratricopeptide (TPR) repeat protein
MKKNYLFYLSFLALITVSCKSDTSTGKIIKNEIPELLNRNEKIQLGKEWDYVQNFYSDQSKILKADYNNGPAKLKLAELFIKEARVTGEHGHYYPAALKMVNEILQISDIDKNIKFQALVSKAGVQLSLHEFQKAYVTAESALRINKNNAQIHGVMVDCLVELGNYNEAINVADRMISIKPDIRSYSRISYLREINGDVEGAIEALELAIKSGYPGYEETAWAMQTLADLYLLYGDLDKSEKIYNEILSMRENYPFAVGGLAEVEYQKGNLKEAEVILHKAIDIIPEVGFYVQLAHIYKDRGEEKLLKKTTDEVFIMLEDDVKAGHNMNLEYADIYLNLLNNNEKATEYILKEFDKRPKNIDVNRVYAKILLADNKYDEAKYCASRASVTNSKHPDLKNILAELTDWLNG